jgi:hypothetical protein
MIHLLLTEFLVWILVLKYSIGMAAVSIVKPLAVAGFHVAPTTSDLRKSSIAYVYFMSDMISSC